MTRKNSKRPERRPPGEQDPSADKKDADWGFEQGDEEKVLEPRLGIVLVICLLLIFGFLLYYKYQNIQDVTHQSLVESRSEEEGTGGEPKIAVDESKTLTASTEDGGLFAPFDHSEATPKHTTAHSASTPQSHVSEDYNPFATTDESSESTHEMASAPPAQSEPSPFGGPASEEHHFSHHGNDAATDVPGPNQVVASVPPVTAQRDVSDSSSASFAGSHPFFDHEPSTPEPEPTGAFGLEPMPADHAPSPSSNWSFGDEQQLANGNSSNPDSSAAHTESHEETFGSPSSHLYRREPHPLESVDVAMPLPHQQQEPDPFASREPLHTSPADEWEPNPLGGLTASQEQAHHQSSTSSNWSFSGDSQDHVADTSQALPAPQLPSLAAPSEHQFSSAETGWNLEHAPQPTSSHPSLEEPVTPFSSTPGRHHVRSKFSMAATPLPVVGERDVTVTRNDSLWSISQESYGTARYVPALARYNQDRVSHPDKLRLGVQIRIPPPEVLEVRFPELFRRTGHRDAMVSPAAGASSHPSRTSQAGLFLDSAGRPIYRVGKNDTLTQISQKHLGRASRWTEILAMNRDRLKSPETLKPGMVLRMPADAGRVAVFSGSPLSR